MQAIDINMVFGNCPALTVGGAQEEPKAAELSRCVLEIG